MQPTLASVPGALIFRFLVTSVVILVLIVVFLSYVDGTQQEFERNSMQQTQRVIDSSLAVVFATYAVEGRLEQLNELDGANPFVFLAGYQLIPTSYKGEIGQDPGTLQAPGWYYLTHRRRVAYKARHLDGISFFAVVLSYQDLNQSGRFEPESDRFHKLHFVKTAQL